MKDAKVTSYLTPELEIILFETNDIVTTSGYEPDDNVDEDWK